MGLNYASGERMVSISAISSDDSFQPTVAAFDTICSGLVAPAMTDVTPPSGDRAAPCRTYTIAETLHALDQLVVLSFSGQGDGFLRCTKPCQNLAEVFCQILKASNKIIGNQILRQNSRLNIVVTVKYSIWIEVVAYSCIAVR